MLSAFKKLAIIVIHTWGPQMYTCSQHLHLHLHLHFERLNDEVRNDNHTHAGTSSGGGCNVPSRISETRYVKVVTQIRRRNLSGPIDSRIVALE